jgi:hypothetical protein
LIFTLSSDAIVIKLTFIDDAIGPNKLPQPIKQAIKEVALVAIAIFEGDLSGSIEALAIDLAVLRRGGYLSLPVLIEDFS